MRNQLVVDIARYTAGIDPLPLLEGGAQMIILKLDDMFITNGKILADAGMPIAAYHWIDPTRDAKLQAAQSLDLLQKSGLKPLAVFPDFEQYWMRWDQWYKAIRGKLAWNLVKRFNAGALSKHAEKVFEEFSEAGWKTIGYTRASFITEYARGAADWMPKYQWWLAHYINVDRQTLTWEELRENILPKVNFEPNLPPRITSAHVVGHQFTGDRLSLPGLYGDVRRAKYSAADVNLFDDTFLKKLGAVPAPKPLPAKQYEAVVTAAPALNVRSGAGTNYPVLYSMPKDTKVELSYINDNGWAKVRAYGEEWCSAQYLRILTATEEDVEEHGEEPKPGEADNGGVPTLPDFHYPGVEFEKTRRFNSDCYILKCDVKGKRFHATKFTQLRTVSAVAKNMGAQIVINGDGWGVQGRYPKSIAASDGNFYQRVQEDYNPWINISKDNQISFGWRKPANLYNAISGDRYLVDGGKYNQAITNVSRAPRTSIGLGRDDRLLILIADGRAARSVGLTFYEMGILFLEMGAVTAINLDGGGSTALWIEDRIVNIPIEAGVPGRERAVANHLCVFIS